MALKALGLPTGMTLQTRHLVERTSKKESQFYGAIEGKGLTVDTLGSESDQAVLEAGEIYVVRGLTGQYEFSFVSKVLQAFEKPLVYAPEELVSFFSVAFPLILADHAMRIEKHPDRISEIKSALGEAIIALGVIPLEFHDPK